MSASTSVTSSSPWLLRSGQPAPSGVRLIAFPYAGGGGWRFRRWLAGQLPAVDVVSVQLPGRENRLREPSIRDLPKLVDVLAAELRASGLVDGPGYVFFGHSLGSLIAFEVARELRRQGVGAPRALLVSGRRPPQLRTTPSIRHTLSDDDLIREIARLQGMSADVLNNREMLELTLPALRGDLALDETYVYVEEAPFACPIMAFGGQDDLEVSPEQLSHWAVHTRSQFSMAIFSGGHFFFETSPAQFTAALVTNLDALTAAVPLSDR
jgi:medium-chain acyl-[acyl-carrier-protein] hydrolase